MKITHTHTHTHTGFHGGSDSKECLPRRRHRRHGFDSCVRKMTWRMTCQPSPLFLPGEARGRGALWAAVQGSQRVGHDCSNLACMHAMLKTEISLEIGEMTQILIYYFTMLNIIFLLTTKFLLTRILLFLRKQTCTHLMF